MVSVAMAITATALDLMAITTTAIAATVCVTTIN
jgi:hypothetical protein